jgi:ribonuclease P protein component
MHNKNSKEGFGKVFRIGKFFRRRKLKIYFLYKKAAKKLKVKISVSRPSLFNNPKVPFSTKRV